MCDSAPSPPLSDYDSLLLALWPRRLWLWFLLSGSDSCSYSVWSSGPGSLALGLALVLCLFLCLWISGSGLLPPVLALVLLWIFGSDSGSGSVYNSGSDSYFAFVSAAGSLPFWFLCLSLVLDIWISVPDSDCQALTSGVPLAMWLWLSGSLTLWYYGILSLAMFQSLAWVFWFSVSCSSS